MQNQCAEIKIRAERRMGEMHKVEIDHKGGRPKEKRLHDETVSKTSLADVGIDKNESHRYQQMAIGYKIDLSRVSIYWGMIILVAAGLTLLLKTQAKETDSQPSEDSEQPKGFWYPFSQLIKYLI